MVATTERIPTSDEIKAMLASGNPRDNGVGLGYLLDSILPIGPFVEEVKRLVANDSYVNFGMSVGDIAALVLDVTGVVPYEGENEKVRHNAALYR